MMEHLWALSLLLGLSLAVTDLIPCGNVLYSVNNYTCYGGKSLCPVVDGKRTLQCGSSCYLANSYLCSADQLQPASTSTQSPSSTASVQPPGATGPGSCSSTYLHLSDPPYEDYFLSDCTSASQVVVTSPQPDSNLTIIGPRLIVAWPAGNSGIVVYFGPSNGINGTLGISLENLPNTNQTLSSVVGGVGGILNLNSSALLEVSILGSIRTIRDFTEGPSILVPQIQNATKIAQLPDGGIQISRMWLDNVTETFLTFQSTNGSTISTSGGNVSFPAGNYSFKAWFTYPQLDQLSAQEVLTTSAKSLISQNETDTESLSFLSYSNKLLAGAWRFLTYFGRDSMISLLLLQPILSEGEGGAIEAVLGAALERINSTDGSVCHEETIGDYATYLNEQEGIYSTEMQCDYKMIDSDYYLPIALNEYLVKSKTGASRRKSFLATNATLMTNNTGMTYGDLALITAKKIMNLTAAFEKSPVKDNLLQLKEGQIVGQWRDSTYGIGGGRFPYDVNTALAPAALRAIASLSANGVFSGQSNWSSTASTRAKFWEDNTLSFFEVSVNASEAKSLVQTYVNESDFSGTVDYANVTSGVTFHGLALDGNNNQSLVRVMNTDDCFRVFLLNTTNQTQLSSFLSQTADHILSPFPIGLSTPVGLLIANPAYGGAPVYAANWTTNAYHGTVIWSWQMAMLAAGLERQLGRCNSNAGRPDFCSNTTLHDNIVSAYNHLWDLIEANTAYLSSEMWSWVYQNGNFQYTSLGDLAPPPGQSPTESDIRQLWSLTFLAVKRNEGYRS